VKLDADRSGTSVGFEDGARMRVVSDWTPGQPLARLDVEGEILVLKVARIPTGYRVRVRGADLKVTVMSPRMAELASHIPEKAPLDTSKFLLCPMPGLVVRIDVKEGDEVYDGQALAMVEAMKMENVLRAERRARVVKLLARPGDSLAVDDVIMEFE
jgi:propionyl-CoA carboxylase alpha chain